jgi:hypothetical protein
MMRKLNTTPAKTKKYNSNSFGVVALSTYTSPKVVEVRNTDWVAYGEDNNYFQYLIDRYNGSPTNNAIINGISQMIYGKGIDATDSTQKPEEYAQMLDLLTEEMQERCTNDLKAMGQCAIQVVYNIDHTRITECTHFPIETLRAGKCDEEGDINFYYYSKDWTQVSRTNLPEPIPAFGTSNADIEILYVKPYKTGYYYYSPVDYQGCLQYCELEEEISNYHLNNIMNGLAPSMLINFSNGEPTETEKRDIEQKIQQKFSGTSNAGRFILSFSDSKENNATIEPVQLSDAHNQYQFLSDESMRKIMVGHRVISPMLLGIKDNTGLGNNAEELKTASILMDNTTIRPFQNLLINAFNKVLAYNDISLNLYFKTLQPLEFNDLSNATSVTTIETETGQKLSKLPELTEHIASEILQKLTGEKINEEWQLVATRKYDENNISIQDWAKQCNLKVTLKTGGFITSNPSEKSFLDEEYYKVRYSYEEESLPSKTGTSREFCVNMMGRTANGVVYRKEDIDQASFSGVNNSFGHNGQSYSLFQYKGGPNCHHFFAENLYQRKIKDGKPVEDKALSSNEEVPFIEGYNPQPNGWDNAQIAPALMENEGHHPDWVAKNRA